MTGDLIAQRLVEDDVEDGAGGVARYALYAVAIVAALGGAWLIAAPSSDASRVAEPLTVRSTPMPTASVRQIDLSKADAPSAPVAAAAPAPAPAVETAAADPLAIPPKPVPKPVRTAAVEAPVARSVAAAPAEPRFVQTGAPPSNLGVLHEPAPRYVAPQPVYVPQPPVAAAAPAGPVPPMPIDDVAQQDLDPMPVGTAVRHQGLLGAGEQAVGTAWNWTTGTVNGVVDGVKRTF